MIQFHTYFAPAVSRIVPTVHVRDRKKHTFFAGILEAVPCEMRFLQNRKLKGDMLWFIGLSDQGGRPVAPFYIVVDE